MGIKDVLKKAANKVKEAISGKWKRDEEKENQESVEKQMKKENDQKDQAIKNAENAMKEIPVKAVVESLKAVEIPKMRIEQEIIGPDMHIYSGVNEQLEFEFQLPERNIEEKYPGISEAAEKLGMRFEELDMVSESLVMALRKFVEELESWELEWLTTDNNWRKMHGKPMIRRRAFINIRKMKKRKENAWEKAKEK